MLCPVGRGAVEWSCVQSFGFLVLSSALDRLAAWLFLHVQQPPSSSVNLVGLAVLFISLRSR